MSFPLTSMLGHLVETKCKSNACIILAKNTAAAPNKADGENRDEELSENPVTMTNNLLTNQQ